MNKIYIDLATITGYAVWSTTEKKIHYSGSVNLQAKNYHQLLNNLKCALNKKMDIFLGSKKFIFEKPITNNHFNSKQTIRMLYGMFGVISLLIENYDEINPATWFKGITAMFPNNEVYKTEKIKILNGDKFTYKKNDDGTFATQLKIDKKNKPILDRKKTSIKIASLIMLGKKIITDDNEADAICMAYWDNMKEGK